MHHKIIWFQNNDHHDPTHILILNGITFHLLKSFFLSYLKRTTNASLSIFLYFSFIKFHIKVKPLFEDYFLTLKIPFLYL